MTTLLWPDVFLIVVAQVTEKLSPEFTPHTQRVTAFSNYISGKISYYNDILDYSINCFPVIQLCGSHHNHTEHWKPPSTFGS